MKNSDILLKGWMDNQNASLYRTWRIANPGEDSKLRYYWNHEGPTPALVTPTGKQQVSAAEAYYGSLRAEALLVDRPLPLLTIQAWLNAGGSISFAAGMNGWPTVVIPCQPDTPVFAIVDGKIPHVYDYFWSYDGFDGLRWGYNNLVPVAPFNRKPKRGEVIGRTKSAYLELSCQQKLPLLKAISGE